MYYRGQSGSSIHDRVANTLKELLGTSLSCTCTNIRLSAYPLIMLLFLLHPFHGVLQLADDEVNLQRRFRLAGLHVGQFTLCQDCSALSYSSSHLFTRSSRAVAPFPKSQISYFVFRFQAPCAGEFYNSLSIRAIYFHNVPGCRFFGTPWARTNSNILIFNYFQTTTVQGSRLNPGRASQSLSKMSRV